MSADLLRQAATTLRERSAMMSEGAWKVLDIDAELVGAREDQWFVMGSFDAEGRNPHGPFAVCDWEPSAAYIATMHPGVGLALADLLDALAADHEQADVDGGTWDHHVVPLARLIVGGAS